MSRAPDTMPRPGARRERVPRRRARWALLALLTGILLLAGGAAAGAEEPLAVNVTAVDVASFPAATAVVQIGGAAALQAGALSPESFAVSVGGVPVDGARARPTASEPVPSATLLLIDESGSMKGAAAEAAKAAARRYIETMRSVDSVAVYGFNEETRVLHDFSADKASLSGALDTLSPGKETALYDAVTRALSALEAVAGVSSRYLVLLSDGGDTASAAGLEDTLARVRAGGTQLYAVGLKTKEFDASPLARFAEVSGGRYLETPDPAALSALYDSLAKEIQNQYVVELQLAPGSAGSGAGTLEVAVTAAGVTAQGSRGFFYPPAAQTQTPATTSPLATAAGAAPALTVAPDPTLVGRLVDWKGGDYSVALLVAMLLFSALWFLQRALFPRRDVLAEYSDILENRKNLGPPPTGEETTGGASRFVDRLLRARGYHGPLQTRIEDAGWRLRSSEFVLLQLGAIMLCALVLGAVSAPLWLAIVVVTLAVVGPLLYLDARARRRRATFESQVPDTLTTMANALRAGQGFEQALQVVSEEGPNPTAHEFRRLLAQQRLGVPPEETLRTLADRMGSEAFDWVVLATTIQRQVGGNLAEIYDSIAETLRQREALKGEIRTLTAEGRISALILVLLPFVVAAGASIANPPYAALLYTTRPGLIMIGASILAMIVGIFWLRRIIRFDV
ncbi:MAG: type II secretion system F family protein [Thermoleophilia bacterium]